MISSLLCTNSTYRYYSTHLFNQEHATPFYNPIINFSDTAPLQEELELENCKTSLVYSVLNCFGPNLILPQVRFFASSRVVYGMLAKYCGTSQQFRGFCIERGSGDTLLCLFGQWKNAFKLLDTRSSGPFAFSNAHQWQGSSLC